MSKATELVPAGTELMAAEDGSGVTVEGSLVININGEDYTLKGTVGSHLIVKYERDFPDGANIGTILDIIDAVGKALGAPGIKEKVEGTMDSLKSVPILADVVKVLTTSPIQITYLEINTATSTYGFGFALDFRNQNIEAAGIKLNAFGLKVSYVKPS